MLQQLLEMHIPDGHKADMVYSVWEDGEVTLEKGAELFGQRNMHIIMFGGLSPLQGDALPVKNFNGSHSRIFVKDHDTAVRAHNLILGL